MFQATTALHKLLKLHKRIRAICGGTSASKTISIEQILIDYAQTHPNEVISIVSETFPHLKRGAIRDFLNIMVDHGYFVDERWNKTDSIYKFESNAIIEFFSADQPARVRGPRRDVLFINEANNLSYETFTQLEIRTKKIVWLDWNPVSEFWYYTEIDGKRQDIDFLTLTYKDNEALDKSIVQTIEARRANANWWKVYGEGLLGESEGRIFRGWKTDLDAIPQEARLERYGLDFGYSNDPTAIVGIYKWNGAIILDEVCYQKGMSNKDIADLLSNLDRRLVKADSSEPKSIDEIKKYGITIIGAQKGTGSILQGIQYVQDQKVFVTKRSINLIKEYRNYLWITDKDGSIINEPQDFMNHCMDAIRYGLEGVGERGFRQNSDVGGMQPYIEGLIA